MKALIKRVIKLIPINFTKNQRYDRQTQKVIKKVCKPNSNGIDVGCHKGEILDILIKYAPNGIHFGFEPIPFLFDQLIKKYKGSKHKFFAIALSNKKRETNFNLVLSNPAYSGLIKRKYDKANEIDQQITVQTDLLDHIIPADTKIDFIKIDVEGGELLVLEGAINTIKRNKPIIIFEHGIGASDCYQVTPTMVYDLLTNCGMEISTMGNWLNHKAPFTLAEFEQQFYKKINYYFIAYPKL